MKKNIQTLLFLVLLVAMICFPVEAASKAETNRVADALYMDKVQEMKSNVQSIWYKFTDITGDGIHEAMIFGKTIGGSGSLWKIYTYKAGTAKIVFDGSEYGLDKLVVYKRTKSFYYHREGHGWEATFFYQLKNGRYKEVARKTRNNNDKGLKGGGWGYKDSKKRISKVAYNKLIKKYKKGKATKMNTSKWTIEFLPENNPYSGR